ncbi:RNA polymerase II subunit A C-terminal domain phosphatase SSU72-like [Bicyclus anynana]|uniref:RNA polymerase II subunit A C-terminal domain phosphatase SSU72 n=1 Tax=Bicyclus anynana TaxID=110368 RepID=A0ABM3M6V2_BICAN|nr:RNA polymerase II subunit A C-terminal domain phosphatase SSU72-like [Bicyclus anynana]
MNHLSFAIVCSANMNRSMEAHAFLIKKGFNVKSYGTADKVRLPGLTFDSPNCYDFGTPYQDIYNDLVKQNKEFYNKNGILHMLQRNKLIKPSPERLQETSEQFDIIITCAEKVYDQVIEWLEARKRVTNHPVHIVNMEIVDTHDEAMIAAFVISDLAKEMVLAQDLDEDIGELLKHFESKCHRQLLFCTMYY